MNLTSAWNPYFFGVMSKIKYYYDTEKCKYERIRTKPRDILLNIFGFLSLAFLMALALLFTYRRLLNLPDPELAQLRYENSELKSEINSTNKDVVVLKTMLKDLQNRDEGIYRMVTGAPSMPDFVRNPNVTSDFDDPNMSGDVVTRVRLLKGEVEGLYRATYNQTKSYDEIIKLAKNKEELLSHMPAIQPIENQNLKRLASGFGYRIHPILKIRKLHTGLDFSAEKGTPIRAAGDGVVRKVKTNYGGYGKEVEIDHGYGYVTKYAHMQNFNVKYGQRVKRGDIIGYVGNTGSSTAPHLHYEVIRNGKKVNPVHYIQKGLTEEEYEEILRLSTIENQSLG